MIRSMSILTSSVLFLNASAFNPVFTSIFSTLLAYGFTVYWSDRHGRDMWKKPITRRSHTMQEQVTLKEWVEMFRELGLDEESMMRWHHIFELRYPEGHQSFLEWLGLSADKVASVRLKSK